MILQFFPPKASIHIFMISKGRGQNYFGRDPAGSCRIPTKDDTRYFLNKLAVETQKAEVRARGG